MHRRLTRLAKTAEDFRDVVGAVWAPKLGAYVCAAHFLEHHLRETAAGLVLDAAEVRSMRCSTRLRQNSKEDFGFG